MPDNDDDTDDDEIRRPLTAGEKTSTLERIERRREVEQMLALQFRGPVIARRLAPKYNVTARMIRKDIEDITSELKLTDIAERPHRKNKMRETLLDLYRRALGDKAWVAAGAALDKLCKIDGLYEAERYSVTHTHSDARAEIEALDDAGRKAFRDIIARVELAKRIHAADQAPAATLSAPKPDDN